MTNAKLYQKVQELEQRLEKAELEIELFKNKKSNSYAGLESRMAYREDGIQNLKKYNEVNGTEYKYIPEAIQKEFLAEKSVADIATAFGMTKTGIYMILKKLGTERRDRGGSRIRIIMKSDSLAEIRDKNNRASRMAAKYGVSAPTIYCIRRREGRWADV